MAYNEELKKEIPEGWAVKYINDIDELISGYPFSSDCYTNISIYKLYTIRNVQDGYIVSKVDNFIIDIPSNMNNECLLRPKDLLMSLTGNVARCGLVYDNNCLLNQRVLKIKTKINSPLYDYCLYRSDNVKKILESKATGTSQKNLSPIEIGKMKVLVPSSDILNKWESKYGSIISKIVKCYQENQELASLRDYLLPLLMNGQVTIK